MGGVRWNVLIELEVIENGADVGLLRELREKGAKLFVVSAESRRSRAEVAAALSAMGFTAECIGLGAQLAAMQLRGGECMVFGDDCFVNDLKAAGVKVIEPIDLGKGKAWEVALTPVSTVVIGEDSRWKYGRSAIATRCVVEGRARLCHVGGNVRCRGDVVVPGGRGLAVCISVAASSRDVVVLPEDVAGLAAAVAFAGGCDVILIRKDSEFDGWMDPMPSVLRVGAGESGNVVLRELLGRCL